MPFKSKYHPAVAYEASAPISSSLSTSSRDGPPEKPSTLNLPSAPRVKPSRPFPTRRTIAAADGEKLRDRLRCALTTTVSLSTGDPQIEPPPPSTPSCPRAA